MSASLVFDGTIEICDPGGHVSDASYWFETLAEGASFGDPQPVEVVVASLIRDGAIVTTTGDENREPSFLIRVNGTDSRSLREGVQALQLATRKRTTLVWTTPDGYDEPLAWDVETSNLLEASGLDDLALVKRNQQVYRLRLVAQPYRRSLTLEVDDAGTPPSGGGDLIDSCESTTGWASWGSVPAGSYSVDSVTYAEGAGSVKSEAQTQENEGGLGTLGTRATNQDEITGLTIDTGTGGYLSVAIRMAWDATALATAELDSVWMQIGGSWIAAPSPISTSRKANGFVYWAWPVDADLDVTGLRFRIVQVAGAGAVTVDPFVWYDDIELLPSATTDHQIVKQHFVKGSARTTASLRVAAASESTALDKVLAITVPTGQIPDGFQPDGERWVTQGTTTSDASALAGHYYTPHASIYDDSAGKPIFDVPAKMLTAGPYTMVSLVKVESPPLVAGVQAQLLVDGTEVGPTSAAEVSIPDLDPGWAFVPLGTVYLPPLPVQNADDTTKVRLLFKGAKLANVYMIPAWEMNGYPVAEFSIVDCGTGTVEPGGASSSLFIDSPSILQPDGGLWRGPTPDRANAQSAWPDTIKPGVHVFHPGSVTHFLVSLGAAGPTSTLSYYPKYL